MKVSRLLGVATLGVFAASASATLANSTACASRSNNTISKLTECVTVDGVRAHQRAFQDIADTEGFGIRASGTPGYDGSAEYVANQLEAAGYNVTIQPFTFNGFIVLSPPVLEEVSPGSGSIPTNIMSYSGSGEVTASVSTVNAITGCDAADFAGFPAGDVALISRGACTFALKAENAFDAGAAGVVIYNNIPGTLNGTLSSDFALDIPVVSVDQSIGQTLAATPDLVLRLKTDTLRGEFGTVNVIAETPGGNPDNVVMVGAHLDSVDEGPGIQDNGSGSAAILEVALQMSKVKPRNKVRFAWWGAEESGLIGSDFYVLESLSDAERDKIALYLNFDMIGSPNFVYFVYDGSGDAYGLEGPQGSAEIETFFQDFYSRRGLSYEPTEISFRSDYAGFFDSGIPFGGLFTGAEGIKTAEQASVWGGTAGEQFDPCYHLACDTFDNISLEALDVNSDAVAASVLHYSMNTEAINGLRGKGNFKEARAESGNLGNQKVK